MINWLLICGIAFGSMAVAEKSNSNYIVVFTETYIKMNATYGNSTHSIGKDSNVTVTLNSTQLIRNGTVRLQLQLKKPTDEVFITTLNYTLDWCYFMDYPFTEPLVYTVYEQAKRDRRNHLLGKCPLKPGNYKIQNFQFQSPLMALLANSRFIAKLDCMVKFSDRDVVVLQGYAMGNIQTKRMSRRRLKPKNGSI